MAFSINKHEKIEEIKQMRIDTIDLDLLGAFSYPIDAEMKNDVYQKYKNLKKFEDKLHGSAEACVIPRIKAISSISAYYYGSVFCTYNIGTKLLGYADEKIIMLNKVVTIPFMVNIFIQVMKSYHTAAKKMRAEVPEKLWSETRLSIKELHEKWKRDKKLSDNANEPSYIRLM